MFVCLLGVLFVYLFSPPGPSPSLALVPSAPGRAAAVRPGRRLQLPGSLWKRRPCLPPASQPLLFEKAPAEFRGEPRSSGRCRAGAGGAGRGGTAARRREKGGSGGTRRREFQGKALPHWPAGSGPSPRPRPQPRGQTPAPPLPAEGKARKGRQECCRSPPPGAGGGGRRGRRDPGSRGGRR